jgi:regulator of protease activity HflC (stomatin/prohibitin superfamily)
LAKFQGLKDLFAVGCAIVTLSEPDLPYRLTTAIEEMWNSADVLRSPLLQSALRQIEGSREAYRHVNELLSSEDSLTRPVLSEV